MTESDILQAGQLLVTLSAWEFVKLGVGRLFKKTVATEYITASQCAGRHSKSDVEEQGVRDALSEMRGIILVIALKVGINEKEIVKLVKQ